MGSRRSADEIGRRAASAMRLRLSQDLRTARLGNGVSQRAAATAAGMSLGQFGRVERGEIASLSLDQACRAAAAVGLRIATQTWPDGDAVRDAGHLRLLARLRALIPPGADWWTEVPLPLAGDRRAWDALIRCGGRRAGCEAETRLTDLQALERRLALKLRDGGVDVLVLAVADTTANRAVLAAHREVLRALLPLDRRAVLRELREGRLPEANGLVVL